MKSKRRHNYVTARKLCPMIIPFDMQSKLQYFSHAWFFAIYEAKATKSKIIIIMREGPSLKLEALRL